MGEEKRIYKGTQSLQNKILNYVVSGVIIIAGVLLAFVPAVQIFFNRFVLTNNYFVYGGTLIVLGLGLLITTIRNRIIAQIIACENGISVFYGKTSVDVLMQDIDYIVSYNRKQLLYTQVYWGGKRVPIQIAANQIQDFSPFTQMLEKQHSDFVLGESFPENIDELSFVVNNELGIKNGKLFCDGEQLEFQEIEKYSDAPFGQRFYTGYAVNLFCKNGQTISSFTEKTQNLLPFLAVLNFNNIDKS